MFNLIQIQIKLSTVPIKMTIHFFFKYMNVLRYIPLTLRRAELFWETTAEHMLVNRFSSTITTTVTGKTQNINSTVL